MTLFLVASGASLTIGIGLGYLIVTLRDAFKRDAQTESDSIPLDEPRPGDREGRPTRSSRP
jgi:hypothetical protein